MRKLVVYPTEKAYHEQAGRYPNVVNFDYFKRNAVVDGGPGITGHIDFLVAPSIDLQSLPGGYDAIECIGFGG